MRLKKDGTPWKKAERAPESANLALLRKVNAVLRSASPEQRVAVGKALVDGLV